MSFTRLLTLYRIAILGHLRKLFANSGVELASIICGATIMLLLYYVANDFFNHKLSGDINEVKSTLYSSFYLLANIFFAKHSFEIFTENSTQDKKWSFTLSLLCEEASTTKFFIKSAKTFKFLVLSALIIALSGSEYLLFHPSYAIGIILITVIFLGVIKLFISKKITNSGFQSFETKHSDVKRKKIISLALWRIKQMYRSAYAVLFYALLIVICSVVFVYLLQNQMPFPLSAFILILQGFFLSAPFFKQLQTDLNNSWFEKNSPIYHDDIYRCYQLMIYLSSIPLGLFNALFVIYIAGSTGVESSEYLHALQAFFLTTLCPFLAPAQMFQIDARKPLIQLIICYLSGLFIGTLILISAKALIALPIIIFYSAKYQKNRFYRS